MFYKLTQFLCPYFKWSKQIIICNLIDSIQSKSYIRNSLQAYKRFSILDLFGVTLPFKMGVRLCANVLSVPFLRLDEA